jgi:hypothetical protein
MYEELGKALQRASGLILLEWRELDTHEYIVDVRRYHSVIQRHHLSDVDVIQSDGLALEYIVVNLRETMRAELAALINSAGDYWEVCNG